MSTEDDTTNEVRRGRMRMGSTPTKFGEQHLRNDSLSTYGEFRAQSLEKDNNASARTIFVDCETGGLEVHRPIVQIAAIAVDRQLQELEEFEVKVRFDEKKACPDALRRVHYRRAEWKRSAIPASKAAWLFAKFLRRHVSVELHGRDLTTFQVAQLASHNSAFDGPFLKAWFEQLGIFMPASYRVFCTLQRAYWFFHEHPELPLPDDFRLGTLCDYFNVPLNTKDAHEAVADVRAAVELYRAVTSMIAGRSATRREYSIQIATNEKCKA